MKFNIKYIVCFFIIISINVLADSSENLNYGSVLDEILKSAQDSNKKMEDDDFTQTQSKSKGLKQEKSKEDLMEEELTKLRDDSEKQNIVRLKKEEEEKKRNNEIEKQKRIEEQRKFDLELEKAKDKTKKLKDIDDGEANWQGLDD